LGRRRDPDDPQLPLAIEENRAIVTQDRLDFENLHLHYLRHGWEHCGIAKPDLVYLILRVIPVHLSTTIATRCTPPLSDNVKLIFAGLGEGVGVVFYEQTFRAANRVSLYHDNS